MSGIISRRLALSDDGGSDPLYRIEIDIEGTGEDITTFPLSVKLTIPPAHYTGSLLQFLDSTGATLPYYLLTYDSGTGNLDCIVKVKLLAAGTRIYLQYQ